MRPGRNAPAGPAAATACDDRLVEAANRRSSGAAARQARDDRSATGAGPGVAENSAASAIGWSALGNWSGQLVSLAFFLALTQLLSPGDIGLFALAMVVQAFLGAFVDHTMGEVVIQHTELSDADLDAAFWLDAVLGFVLVAGTIAGAGQLAAAMGHPQLENVIRALCVAVLIGMFGNIPTAILQRRLQFGLAARIAVVSQVVGGATAVVLALLGWGVWSLVANQLCETAVKTVLTWYRVDWLPKPRVEPASVRSLSSYWLHTIGYRLFFFVRANADRLIIGIGLGPTVLGLYTTAMRIVRMVVDTFCEGVSKAVLAVLSRMRDDPAGRVRGFERLLRLTVLATFPVLGGLAVLGPTLVPMLFGAEWTPAGSILPVLCVIGVGIIVLYLHGITLRVVGRPQVNFAIFAGLTTIDVLLLVVLLPWGLTAALWALAARGVVAIPFYWLWNRSLVGIGAAVLVRSLLPGVASGVAVVLAVLVVEEALRGRVAESLWVSAALAAAAVVYGSTLLAFARDDLLSMLRRRRIDDQGVADAGDGRQAAAIDACTILVADRCEAIGEAWAGLERDGASTPFQTLAWVATAIDTIGRARSCRPKLVLVRDGGGRPAMLVPFVVRHARGLAILEFVDFRTSDYNGPLMRRDFALALHEAGFDALWRRILAAIGPVDALHLEKMPAEIDGVPNPFEQLRCARTEEAHLAVIDGDVAGYLAARSRTAIGNLRRKGRNLAKLGAVALRTADGAEDAGRLAEIMIEWKSRRYRTTGVPDLFADRSYAEFYRTMARREWAGLVHLSVLTLDEKPVSVVLGTTFKGRLCFLMPAFATGDLARFSPGQLHILALVDWCARNGQTILDFTWGNEAYKATWSTHAVPLYTLCEGRTLAGRIWCAAVVLRRTAYRDAKARLSRHPKLLARTKDLRTRLRAAFGRRVDRA